MDRWTEHLSAYVDTELEPAEARRLEEHLLECADCRQILADLREVRDVARMLPDRAPGSDLWPGVLARIEEAPRSGVLKLRSPLPRRSLHFSFPQLVAAGLALMLTGAGSAWLALRPAGDIPLAPTAMQMAEPADFMGVSDYQPPPALRDRLSQLEGALDASRDRLDPQTVAVIEKNLAIVEAAVLEAAQALMKDPANGYLRDHLDRTLQTKVDMLERATSIAQAET